MKGKIFVLEDKKEEVPGVSILKFLPAEGEIFDFKPGQFALFRILKENSPDIPAKAYTIISLPQENFLIIAVKRIGEFSNALCDLEIGDKARISGPFGDFYPIDSDGKDIVFLAGGIGITPFYAVIKDFYKKGIDRRIILFYSNRNKANIAFLKDLEEISEKWKKLEVVHILTREQKRYPRIRGYERLNINMIKKYLGDLGKKDYFICGPSSFVTNIKKQLENAGVELNYIKTESFF